MQEITFFDADKKGNIHIHQKGLIINILNLALSGTLKIYEYSGLILMLVTTKDNHILGIYNNTGEFIIKVETDFVNYLIPKEIIARRLFDHAKSRN
ncbi:MAG: hypothetical protein ACFFG0_15520 [Candidatus Thorarchaeota archaeon]